MDRHIIDFKIATDTDLQVAAAAAGYTVMEDLMVDGPLTRTQRNSLIIHLQKRGYKSIDITNPYQASPSKYPPPKGG